MSPAHGSVFVQSVALGLLHTALSFLGNLLIALSAAQLASWLARNPGWLAVQRWFMGFVLAALALRLLAEERRP